MLIDEFLPKYDIKEYHEIFIYAPVEAVYENTRALNLNGSKPIYWLCRLRGMPDKSLTLEGILNMDFILLGEIMPQEFALGLAGKFWTPGGDLQRISKENFRKFDRAGYAKAVWNFALDRKPDNIVRLSTETRVYGLDAASRRNFLCYWRFISPFSGFIRKKLLRNIKHKAEAQFHSSKN